MFHENSSLIIVTSRLFFAVGFRNSYEKTACIAISPGEISVYTVYIYCKDIEQTRLWRVYTQKLQADHVYDFESEFTEYRFS